MKFIVVFFALCAVAAAAERKHDICIAGFNPGRLCKRSLAPFAAPAAVSHQSRVDVISSPAVVSHAVTVPLAAHAPVVAAVHAVTRARYAAPYYNGYGYVAAAPHNYGYGYYNSAPWTHAW